MGSTGHISLYLFWLSHYCWYNLRLLWQQCCHFHLYPSTPIIIIAPLRPDRPALDKPWQHLAMAAARAVPRRALTFLHRAERAAFDIHMFVELGDPVLITSMFAVVEEGHCSFCSISLA